MRLRNSQSRGWRARHTHPCEACTEQAAQNRGSNPGRPAPTTGACHCPLRDTRACHSLHTTQVTKRISAGLAKRAKAQPSPVCDSVPHLGQRQCAARVPVGRRGAAGAASQRADSPLRCASTDRFIHQTHASPLQLPPLSRCNPLPHALTLTSPSRSRWT